MFKKILKKLKIGSCKTQSLYDLDTFEESAKMKFKENA